MKKIPSVHNFKAAMGGRNFLIVALFFLPLSGYSQNSATKGTPIVQAAELPALPEPVDDAGALKIINFQNAASFKTLLPAELQPLFRDGQLEIEAASRLRNPLHYGDDWNKASEGAKVNVLNGLALRSGVKLGEGFLFGNAHSLESEDDPKVLAQKILWNIYSLWAGQRVFGSLFEFHWFRETAKPYRTMKGEFSRIYPTALNEPKQTAQLFRELIRFTSPAVLTDLSWLTFRFLGFDEDVLWVFSPSVKKIRQLTAANRADSILRSAVSPEDFLVWSGKPELVDARVVSSDVTLAPFLRSEVPAVTSEAPCVGIDRSAPVANRLAVRWNFETSRFAHGAAWVPNTSVLIPRKLWRIELSSQDPFNVYGRQVLYVDEELMLPLYKFVYNRSGQLWKTIIGSFGIAAVENSAARMPYPAYILTIDHLKNEAYVVDFSNIKLCTEPAPGLTLVDFDPKRFMNMAKNDPATPVPTAAAQVPTEEVDER